MSIEYSDGDAIEQKIIELLAHAPRKSSDTPIAAEHYADWAVRYHLCPERANLLRPFDFHGLKTLELGAGMGAVSRFLAENSDSLTVIEGTQQRFEALSQRLSDLTNWNGKVANIGEVVPNEKFDVVCSIGVMEYSELFISGSHKLHSSFYQFLERARSFLNDEGVLILAIENRLGMKYWSGASEDHSGAAFDGIAGYPGGKSAKTFSLLELKNLLRQSGFSRIEEFFPYPDYKIPSTVLSRKMLDSFPEVAADIVSGIRSEDYRYGTGRDAFFPEALANASLSGTGLLGELSNSFLLFASLSLESKVLTQLLRRHFQGGECGWHYSSRRKNRVETLFRQTESGLSVKKIGQAKSLEDSTEFLHSTNVCTDIIPGDRVAVEVLRQLYFGSIKEAENILVPFFQFAFASFTDVENKNDLSGQALDATISNCKVQRDTLGGFEFNFFDLEWSSRSPMRRSWFVLRSLLSLSSERWAISEDAAVHSLKDWYVDLCQKLGVIEDFDRDIYDEAKFLSHALEGNSLEEVERQVRQIFEQSISNKWYPRVPGVLSRSVGLELKNRELSARIALRRYELADILHSKVSKYRSLFRIVKGGIRYVLQGTNNETLMPLKINSSNALNESKFRIASACDIDLEKFGRVNVKFSGETNSIEKVQLELKKNGLSTFVNLGSVNGNKLDRMLKVGEKPDEISLVVIHRAGNFGIESVSVRGVSKPVAALRLILPQIPGMLRHRTQLAHFIEKGKLLWKDGKVRGLIAWVHQQALLGPIAVADRYSSWVANYDLLDDSDRAKIRNHLSLLKYQPKISIVMPVYNTDERWLRAAIDSVRRQLYSDWELCISEDCSTLPHVKQVLSEYEKMDSRIRVCYREKNGHISAATNSALSLASGEFVAFLDHDDELSEQSLYHIVVELNRNADLDLIYSDEDKIDESGRRHDPHFKTNWNIDLLYSYNMVTHLCVYRRAIIERLGGCRIGYEGSQDYDLLLRASEVIPSHRISHLPYVLYHWRAIPGSVAGGPGAKNYAHEAARKALRDHFDRIGVKARVEAGLSTYHRVRYELPTELPLVSLIICTRDRVELLKVIVDGILTKTDYQNLELLIVDNQSVEPATKDYFSSLSSNPRVKIVSYDAPFNFSAMNNFAANIASGEFLGFLNNDLEVIHKDWLKEMVSFVVQEKIGAVGAKLYFPDDTIQHAGILLGIQGVAGHAHKRLPKDEGGYIARASVIQQFSAVTGACLLTRKKVFQQLGGFDEKNLVVAFNDVDFGMKLNAAGYRVVFTPYAELYHHESATRGPDTTSKNWPRFQREVKFMVDKWQNRLSDDPFYNPNLTRETEDLALAFPPFVKKPWDQNRLVGESPSVPQKWIGQSAPSEA